MAWDGDAQGWRRMMERDMCKQWHIQLFLIQLKALYFTRFDKSRDGTNGQMGQTFHDDYPHCNYQHSQLPVQVSVEACPLLVD